MSELSMVPLMCPLTAHERARAWSRSWDKRSIGSNCVALTSNHYKRLHSFLLDYSFYDLTVVRLFVVAVKLITGLISLIDTLKLSQLLFTRTVGFFGHTLMNRAGHPLLDQRRETS